jgi:hypothetical protein
MGFCTYVFTFHETFSKPYFKAYQIAAQKKFVQFEARRIELDHFEFPHMDKTQGNRVDTLSLDTARDNGLGTVQGTNLGIDHMEKRKGYKPLTNTSNS